MFASWVPAISAYGNDRIIGKMVECGVGCRLLYAVTNAGAIIAFQVAVRTAANRALCDGNHLKERLFFGY